ncbi:hypothetical protein, partial [Ornithobacterium rhinotracheale]
IKNIELKELGVSTLSPRKIWFDEAVKRLNVEGRGKYIGALRGEYKILTIHSDGVAQLTNFDLTNHYHDNILFI